MALSLVSVVWVLLFYICMWNRNPYTIYQYNKKWADIMFKTKTFTKCMVPTFLSHSQEMYQNMTLCQIIQMSCGCLHLTFQMLGHISKQKLAESIVKKPQLQHFSLLRNVTASGCHRQTHLIPQGHGLSVIAATSIKLDDLRVSSSGESRGPDPLKITQIKVS